MDEQSVRGKTIFISGGTTGIGRATALLLLDKGARVGLYGDREDELQDALEDMKKTGGKVYGVSIDHQHDDQVIRFFEDAVSHMGKPDVMINNAAIGGGPAVGKEIEQIHQVINTNLEPYMTCSKLAVDYMKENGGGDIVNIGSLSAEERQSGSGTYVASKAGIEAFSESLRKRVNPMGIRVMLIQPGLVDTNLGDQDEMPREQKEEMVTGERMLRAPDIAELIHFCITRPHRLDIIRMDARPLQELI